ncbi:hypothetical protein BAUCODRAFT_125841 [Baudoinia panamericana UAMH 10762]|uniref:Methyltransferase domain-containing protein n=1 Tax=Baudoinia panamericana (strain UAMH 10762) TaxID=717646 RepID=M2M904_BAUPA|nr:uncharacterized protein BAUCODRAFT_125841 [Baudoinia panamericana UAMH 10762]EMC92886.1 hypothetical protein BAUCODRAFT_125841 [Baudoinia panamericana UAMH 10762]
MSDFLCYTLFSRKSDPDNTVPQLTDAHVASGFGFYVFQLGLAVSQPCHNPDIADLSRQKDVAARYDYTAANFDSEVGFSELISGINSKRKRLAQQCKGNVLEVSCGTGRNLGYYDIKSKNGEVQSLSFIDLSPQMIDVCRKKWDALYRKPIEAGTLKRDLKVRFMTGSALEAMPLAPNGNKYDTVFQTMGLCSTSTPAALLVNMARHLDLSKSESRILLLEHGRSYLPWMNRILDNAAEKHAERHGCWFNREIGQLVEDAARQTGLEVVNERRYHFGTLWLFELKPTDETVKRAASTIAQPDKAEEPKAEGRWLSKLGWW